MAVSEMDYMNIGGGLIKASSWSDAKSKARSYILVKLYGAMGANRVFTLTIPQDDFTSNTQYSTGHYYSASNNSLVTFEPSTGTKTVYYGGSDITSSFTAEYYYDS